MSFNGSYATRPAYLPPHLRDDTSPERFRHPPRGRTTSERFSQPPRRGGGTSPGSFHHPQGGGSTFRRGQPPPPPRGWQYRPSPATNYSSSRHFDNNVAWKQDEVVEEGNSYAPRGRSFRPSPSTNHASPGHFDNVAEKFDELVVSEANIDAYDDTQVEATGSNIPPPVTSFSDIEFPAELDENIRRCKYVKPTPIQKYAIPVAMAGRDLMACAQTGSGKTAAFCFPIISQILKEKSNGEYYEEYDIALPWALILSPTRELSCQIYEEAKKFSRQTGVKVVVVYGGAPVVQQLRNLEKGVDILVATPGRLVDMIERSRVSLRKVKYLALDEADRMLDMGFEPQIRRIVEQMEMPAPGLRQTLLFSATFPDEIQRLSADFLKDYIFLTAGKVGSSTNLIVQKIDLVHDTEKRSHLMNLLDTHRSNGTHGRHALTLVFVETKKGADALEHWLCMKGFPSIAIHGDKVQIERERALKSFKNGRTPILVATDVASRGLDIPHVSHVINFDLPKDIADYVHRIGRTGRAGKSGLATAFFCDKNLPLAQALAELMQEAKQEVPEWLNQYADSSSYNGGSTRSNSYGNRKFGGHDFRSSASKDNGNFNYQSHYSDSYSSKDASAGESPAFTKFNPNAAEYSSNASPDYIRAPANGGYAAPSGSNYVAQPPPYNYGTVCTGWD